MKKKENIFVEAVKSAEDRVSNVIKLLEA